jgi:hypothetical protein
MRFMPTLCAVALMAPVPALSQGSPPDSVRVVDAGSRVRIAAPVFGPKKQVGMVVSVTRDTLVLRQGAATANRSVAVSDITALEVSKGTHTRKAKGSLWGLLIGAGTGAVLGYVTYKPCQGLSCLGNIFGPSSKGGSAAWGAAAGGVLGAAVGALVGMSATESWVPATVGSK